MQFWVIKAQENPAEDRSVIGRREWRSNSICEILADKGHEVYRWRSAFSHQRKEFSANGSVKLRHDNYWHQYIGCPAYKRHVGLARHRNHMALASNFILIADAFEKKPDVIHVANVPIELCKAAVEWGKKHNIPVVVDIRDLWPDIYLDLIPRTLSFIKPVLGWVLDHMYSQVKYLYTNAYAFTGLTQAYLNWALKKANREQQEFDAVFPMTYPIPQNLTDEASSEQLMKKMNFKGDEEVACYFGNIGYQSDFKTLIEAAEKLKVSRPKFRLVIAGSGPVTEKLKQKVIKLGLDNVIIPGWLNGTEIQALMKISRLGMIAYFPIENFLMNIPNKFPEYLAGGLSVACGLGGEMGDIVENTGCGFVYKSGDVTDLADNINTFFTSHSLGEQQRKLSIEVHNKYFHSDDIYPKFSNYLENIALKNKEIGI